MIGSGTVRKCKYVGIVICGIIAILSIIQFFRASSIMLPPRQNKVLNPLEENRIRDDVAATEIIKMRVRNHFKDPESVEIRNVQLFRQGPPDGVGIKAFTYTLCGEVNAKNSFGGYVGYHKFFYTALTDTNSKIREDGSWLEVEPDDAWKANLFSKAYQDQCRDVVVSSSGNDSSSSNSAAQNSDVASRTKSRNMRADETHKSMPPSEWQGFVTVAIKQHCAIEGMTMEEVKRALGNPERVDKLDDGDSWKYSHTDHSFVLFSPHGYMIGTPIGQNVPGKESSSCFDEPLYSQYVKDWPNNQREKK